MRNGIGSLRENDLHRDLITWYAHPDDRLETEIDGYVIDIVRGPQLIEIQTGNFRNIRHKLDALLTCHPIQLVYPISQILWIVKLDAEGNEISRRKSPKRGSVHNIFSELLAFPPLIDHPGFRLELLLIQAEELRQYDPHGPWRRRGWRVVNRRLVKVCKSANFSNSHELRQTLPESLPDPFTTADLARQAGIKRRLAQQMAYCLRTCGIIEIQSRTRAGNNYTQSPG